MKMIKPTWPAPPSVHAFTTTRALWLGQHGADDAEVVTTFELPTRPIWLKQHHGITVVEATPENFQQAADASFTSQPGTICAILTADCLPVLICDRQGSQVAAIHAGWRGLSAGIIEATLDQLTIAPEDTLVWLGPAIGPQKFEVGEDVYDAFVSQHDAAKMAFSPHQPQKWLANLYALAKLRLNFRGINDIYGGDYCTHTQDKLFYSYRRDQGQTGRMASLIWIA
jgi:YfiH family protein